jgi:hypothetical protein
MECTIFTEDLHGYLNACFRLLVHAYYIFISIQFVMSPRLLSIIAPF